MPDKEELTEKRVRDIVREEIANMDLIDSLIQRLVEKIRLKGIDNELPRL